MVRRDVRFDEDCAFRKSLDLRDRDSSQVPQVDQDITHGDMTKVIGAPSTGITGSPRSGVTQLTSTGRLETGVV